MLTSIAPLLLSWTLGGTPVSSGCRASAHPRMDYGDFYYNGHWEPLPEGVFEVRICRPLGIQFEEDGPIIGKSGVSVVSVLDGSNAQKAKSLDGMSVATGDKLVGVTGIKFQGSKWERQMFPCTKWSFDTVVDAIGSNSEKFDCPGDEVILQFKRDAA